MFNIPKYTEYRGETKIALLDNSAISFMEQMERSKIPAKSLLCGYDVIFIPNWVLKEIKDSVFRSRYIELLREEGFPIYTVAEESYADLANGEEGNLYQIVLAAASSLGILKSYMRRYIEKPDPLDMIAYSQWISEMYQNWPISDTMTGTGRAKKKNAGEISLTILAEVISWYYPKIETITVFTQDRDSYHYQINAHRKLKEVFDTRSPVTVSYKSNDFLLYQMYRCQMIDLEKIKNMRKDARVVIYTQKRSDQSVALVSKQLDNEQFAELVRDENCQILF